MGDVLSDQLFKKFSKMVYQKCGINLHEGKKELLQARLNKRLRATGVATYREYYDHITSDGNDNEIIHFLDSISTNLTYFFREPRHFEFLDDVLLPELVKKKSLDSKRIRAWCAGCSTGEEPYSLAMCILSHLDGGRQWDFRILATDISTRVLETAMMGRYNMEKVQKIPDQLRHTYFRKCADSNGQVQFEIVPTLKQIVTFRRLNLKAEFPFRGPFDLIFCRNVMIYFDKMTQQDLVQRMASYLREGGHLFVGHSESLTGLNHSLSYVRPSVYRK
jgi:chemotaxis protein methyltransferase CheR